MSEEHLGLSGQEKLRDTDPMSDYVFRHWHIRANMMGVIRRYIDHGIPTGPFLRAVIENNLSEAVGRADDENCENLPAFVAYFYNEVPSSCWGSPENRKAWIAKGGQKEECGAVGTRLVAEGKDVEV